MAAGLTPQLYKTLHPKPYLSKFLSENLRPDGRPLDGGNDVFRQVSINTGSVSTSAASALVRLGTTTVLTGISLETATPDAHSPGKGFIVPNVDLPALCSPRFRPGPPADEAQALSSKLKDVLVASNVLPLESLIIEHGLAAFVVYIDVVCLSYDGNVFDAAVLSVISALKSLRLPETRWDEDTLACVSEPLSEMNPGRPLAMSEDVPISISFSVYDGQILPDPTAFETDLSATAVTVILGSQSLKLIHVSQAGSAMPLVSKKPALKACIEIAKQRVRDLVDMV